MGFHESSAGRLPLCSILTTAARKRRRRRQHSPKPDPSDSSLLRAPHCFWHDVYCRVAWSLYLCLSGSLSLSLSLALSLSLGCCSLRFISFHIKLGRKIEYDDNLLKAYKAAYAADLVHKHSNTAPPHGKLLFFTDLS